MTRKPRNKKSKSAKNPKLEKQSKIQQEPDIHSTSIAWRFSEHDRGGNWAWIKLSCPIKYKEVIERLQEFENKNWNEVEKSGSHLVEVTKLVKSARDRLLKIHKSDIYELMSFRITGKNRVWCLWKPHVMEILWWDPNHEICPSLKKHT